ncbi:hypothetical protein DCCM_4609 [Desulfocucumis palustris]|uniref:Holin n=1 Tax=Desulfocucumis palustris TaxID=1898651 RepID=A0A2L2XH58_9FIRM|nr:phage holin family protein [Desulfocucumis palustris]GBF35480.1 hypothetical protein DCCM_4609 [Desulfocucumis palustris]
MDNLYNLFTNIINNHAAQLGGIFLGVLTYLVAPTAAFYALWIAVVIDLLTRLVALSVKYGGFWQATRQSQISSKKMFHGTAIKIAAYFFMTVLAHQSKYIVEIEAVPVLFSSIIYCLLFLVEVHSIIENLIDAGAEDLKPLLLRFKREKTRVMQGGKDTLDDIQYDGVKKDKQISG